MTSPKRAARPRLRAAAPEDYEQVAELEARYGLTAKSREEWTHIHLRHPLQPDGENVWPIGWVLENENKQIVGSVGNVPLSYEFGGRRIAAVSGRALVAEPAYRSMALLLLDCLINQPGAEFFLTNAITPASAGAFQALECQPVPVGEWDRSAFWITHYRGFLASLLARQKLGWARALTYPLSAAAYLKDRLTKKALTEGDVEVRACPRFDDRFDEFWENLKRRNPHVMLAVRSREVMEWHFKYALEANRVWIVTANDGPHLAGYAIFDRRDNASLGLKRVRLVDYQSIDGTTDLLAPLLSWTLRRCRKEGIHMLQTVGRWLETGEWLDRVAPYKRKLSTWTYVYRANTPSLAGTLRDRRVWAPTWFDATASL